MFVHGKFVTIRGEICLVIIRDTKILSNEANRGIIIELVSNDASN
ncbi:38261_t:CDS:1, partial [Gigaspora margarita]